MRTLLYAADGLRDVEIAGRLGCLPIYAGWLNQAEI